MKETLILLSLPLFWLGLGVAALVVLIIELRKKR